MSMTWRGRSAWTAASAANSCMPGILGPQRIVESVVKVNDERRERMAERIVAACDGSVDGKTVAVLGLTFKPNTDDMRDAASMSIIPALLAQGAKIRAYDPVGMKEAAAHLSNVEYGADAYSVLEGADCVAILTEWNEFRALDLERVAAAVNRKVIVDLRNIYRPLEMAAAGFEYYSIGRPAARPSENGKAKKK